MTPSDQELIALIREQDTDAFETLSLRYRELTWIAISLLACDNSGPFHHGLEHLYLAHMPTTSHENLLQ